MRIHVRSATPADIPWIVSELKKFSEFFGTKKSLFGDEAFAKEGMLVMMTNHMVLIAEKETVGPVGFIAGVITPHMLNPSIKVLSETFWWVQEEYRNSRAGLLLLEEFMAWGKVNADWITFALESHSPVDDKHLISRGFHLQEKSYLMEVQ